MPEPTPPKPPPVVLVKPPKPLVVILTKSAGPALARASHTVHDPQRTEARRSTPLPAPVPAHAPATVRGAAAALLSGLRAVDPRLLLSEADVGGLVPAVEQWLARGVPPAQITRTVTAGLPHDPIRWPARFLAHRLAVLLPPSLCPLPAGPVPPRLAPLENCDGCDHAFRTHRPGEKCPGCRRAEALGEVP